MQTRLPTEERRAGLVVAALRLSADCSPALITTSDIASAVGLSQGAVFKHFATKDAIWLAAMVSVREQLMALLRQAAAGAATPLDGLQAVFNAHVAFVATHPGVPRLIFHELQKPADSPVKQEVRTLMQAYRKLLTALLAAAVASGQLPAALDQEAAVTLFIGIVQGLVMQSMLSGKPVIAKTQAARVYAIFVRGVLARDRIGGDLVGGDLVSGDIGEAP